MLVTALQSCVGSLEAVRSLSRRYAQRHTLRHLVVAMNGYLAASSLQYHAPNAPYHAPNAPYHAPNAPLLNGFAGVGYAPPQHLLPPPQQAYRIDKPLTSVHYILQNFAFTNSEYYHQSSSTYTRGTSTRARDSLPGRDPPPLSKDVGAAPSSAGSTPHSSREPSPALQDPDTPPANLTLLDDADDADMLEARGVKRHLDPRHSPQKKRSRGQDGTNPQPNVMRNLEMDAMTQYIWQYYEARHQTKEVYSRKMRLREALYTLMKGVFPYCGVYIVGSSMNGFGSGSSDMDMCLMLCQAEINQKKEAPEILRILLKALRTCSFLHKINLIRAKVPILKFQDRISSVEVDLNINNAVGIRNTHLLNAYSRLDWRVSPLVLFVKHWASCQQINDASQGTISSYSLVLMVLHYLQTADRGNPPTLPSLQQMYPTKFNTSGDIRLLTLNDKLPPYVSPNKQSLGDLFVGFLRYYATQFDFEEEAISIRLGKKLPKSLVIGDSNPGQWKFICLEEPFDLSNTARSVYDPYVFQRIRRVFRQSYNRIMLRADVLCILDQPV